MSAAFQLCLPALVNLDATTPRSMTTLGMQNTHSPGRCTCDRFVAVGGRRRNMLPANNTSNLPVHHE